MEGPDAERQDEENEERPVPRRRAYPIARNQRSRDDAAPICFRPRRFAQLAVKSAARRYPEYQWIVANADRFIPYADSSFSIVVSVTARMNAGEFRRVLRGDGRLLVAIPAPDDLIELRNPRGGEGRDRTDRTVETFAKEFTLMDRRSVSTTAELDAEAVRDVLLSIYRPMRSQPVDAMRVTFSLDLLLFRPR